MTNQPLGIIAVLLRIAPCYCSFITNYGRAIINYGKFITNYSKTLFQITAALLQITTMCYYKLRQLYQIIANYGSFWCYYKLQQRIITNYGRYYKLRRHYELHRNSREYGFSINSKTSFMGSSDKTLLALEI